MQNTWVWPDPVNRPFKHAGRAVYTLMPGRSAFGISGRLANRDLRYQQQKPTKPVPMVGAKWDTIAFAVMEGESKMVEKVAA